VRPGVCAQVRVCVRPAARVCVPARACACVCARGCDICATLCRGVVFMHPCCKNAPVCRLLQFCHAFLWHIDDISVSLCNKNSNLVGKSTRKASKESILAHPARATGGWEVRIYTQIHRSGFLKGYKLSQLYSFMLDRPYFLGITAEQEQDS